MSTSIYTTWPLYISSIVLILNDHVLKYTFPGLITGKLSDVVGIFLITLVLRGLFPNKSFQISIGVISAFIWWKSDYSQSVIDVVNFYAPLLIARTIDYSDLVALLIIPLAHSVYENRTKYLVKVRLAVLIKVPVITITALSIMGTTLIIPHHNYKIRKEEKNQSIDIPKAIGIIKREVADHGLECVKCVPYEKDGIFKSKKIELKYKVLENDRGIEFDIQGESGGLFFGKGSWDEMDTIKHRLQNALGHEFEGMEFVMKLGRNLSPDK